MKRESRRGRQRQRVLRLDALDGGDGKDEAEDAGDQLGSDIRDLEFRLSHDLDRLADGRRRLTGREAGLVKAVLLAGLHPQLAVPDAGNAARGNGEMAFHTAARRIALLHPYDPLTTAGWLPEPGQLLAYLNILETTKPYLVHPLPVPGLPALLLFAARIQGNASGSRLLCDGWLELRLDGPETAESALAAAVTLRRLLGDRLARLLQRLGNRQRQDGEADDGEGGGVESRAPGDCGGGGGGGGPDREQRLLANKLAEFLHAQLPHEVRLASAAAVAAASAAGGSAALDSDCVTPWLTLGVLPDDDLGESNIIGSEDAPNGYLERVWHCPACDRDLTLNLAGRLAHQAGCATAADADADDAESAPEPPPPPTSAASFAGDHRRSVCPRCRCSVRGSTADILRHRRDCRGLVSGGDAAMPGLGADGDAV